MITVDTIARIAASEIGKADVPVHQWAKVSSISAAGVFVAFPGQAPLTAPLPCLGTVSVGQSVLVVSWGRSSVIIGGSITQPPDRSWKPITLTGGWWGAASYRIIDGAVEFSGSVSHAVATQGGQIATLNLGGRTLRNDGLVMILNAATGMARVSFWSNQILMYNYFNGGMPSSAGAGVVLDGVRLPLA